MITKNQGHQLNQVNHGSDIGEGVGGVGGWKECKLRDITSKIGSGATPTGGGNAYKSEGLFLIRSQNVYDFTFSSDGLAFIDDKQAQELRNVEVVENDVLINITGESVTRSCIVPKAYLPARVNQHVAIIRAVKEKADFRFVFYSLQAAKPELNSIAEIGCTRRALTKVMLENLEISLPPLPEQRAIASVLSSLDDKIDLLHRQNKTLEAMAETLFRQWFVEEADEGWVEGKLSNIVSVKYGKDHKKLTDGTIPAYGSGGIMRYVETALYSKESVLIPRKGTLNNVVYIDEPFWTVDTMFYTEMKIANAAKFVFHLVNSKDLASMNVGSAVPSMTTEILNNMVISIPDSNTLSKFETTTAPLFIKLKSNRKQIRTLEKLRDKLLPKLMSGEVRVASTGSATGSEPDLLNNKPVTEPVEVTIRRSHK